MGKLQSTVLKIIWFKEAVMDLILYDLLSSCPQSFPASESFPVTQLFASGSQSIETSASASVLSMIIQD